MSCLFSDHYDRRVRVSGDERRHDGRVSDAKSGDTVNPQFVVHYRPGVGVVKLSLLVADSAAKKVQHLTLCVGNTKGGSITVPLTSCLTGLD